MAVENIGAGVLPVTRAGSKAEGAQYENYKAPGYPVAGLYSNSSHALM